MNLCALNILLLKLIERGIIKTLKVNKTKILNIRIRIAVYPLKLKYFSLIINNFLMKKKK